MLNLDLVVADLDLVVVDLGLVAVDCDSVLVDLDLQLADLGSQLSHDGLRVHGTSAGLIIFALVRGDLSLGILSGLLLGVQLLCQLLNHVFCLSGASFDVSTACGARSASFEVLLGCSQRVSKL